MQRVRAFCAKRLHETGLKDTVAVVHAESATAKSGRP